MRRIAIGLSLVAVLACPPAAGAQHNQLEWLSNRLPGAGVAGDTCALQCGMGFTDDGSRVAFPTTESLVPADTDTRRDVYLNDDGVVTLVSVGPTGGNGEYHADYAGATPDLTHVYFATEEPVVADDTDTDVDLYEWSGGVTTLVSTGDQGGNGPYGACSFDDRPCLSQPGAVSDDGSHVFFTTGERLTSEDTDTSWDVYDRTNGTTRLVSTGGGSSSADFLGASRDGSKAFFWYPSSLEGTVWVNSYGTLAQIPGICCGNGFRFGAISRDGARFIFSAGNTLVPADQDDGTCTREGHSALYQDRCEDMYEWSNGTFKLLSAKPDGTGGTGGDSHFAGLSEDEQHVFFTSGKQLVPEDADGPCSRTFDPVGGPPQQYTIGCDDIYEHSGGTTRLISIGPTGGTASVHARFADSSADGSRVLFETTEAVVPGDDANSNDVFERASGTTTLVSVGPLGHGGSRGQISADGSRALFLTSSGLLPEDTDPWGDIYERTGGRTYLVTDFATATTTQAQSLSTPATPDLRHVFVETVAVAVGGDTDGRWDLYRASIGPPTGFPRPKGASPMYVSLVPAYQACTSPNRTHGAPLSFPSCSPPTRSPEYLTVGTPDANGAGAKSVGFLTIAVKPGNAAVEAEDADVRLAMSFTDVRLSPSLDDYTGELQARLNIRLTDSGRSAPITNPPQTVQDFQLRFTATCTATPSSPDGAACSALTTADAVLPGAVREDNRALWQLGQIDVIDGGADGDVETADNGIFARPGVFTP